MDEEKEFYFTSSGNHSSSFTSNKETHEKKKANGKERRKQELEVLPLPTTKSNVPQMILKRLHSNSVRLRDWGFLMRVLSGDMASYVIPHFHSCIKNKDIKDSILTENPAPSNLIKVKKLDEFVPHLLKENDS